MQAFGRFLFRWRSFTPVLLLAVAVPLLWRSRGPASPLWLVAGLLLCASGQALRAWVLGQVPDGTSGQNEKLIATSLNTTGPYELTRNPLYLGNLGITIGLCLVAHDVWLLILAAVLFWLQYRAIIAAEEEFLRSRFGQDYDAFCARVPRFWPRLSTARSKRPWDYRRVLRKEHNPAASWLALAIVLIAADHLHERLWPYAAALGVLAIVWLSVKGWKHRWLHGNFLNDFRRRLEIRGHDT
ncbi:MAG TPA: isoprenylcysteine carboxylmethyltransferase family protein [Myxococcales bacterium]|nr:isoprenylcysteine carboxylmethyltransferase family protein [Myxococcales bacterium]